MTSECEACEKTIADIKVSQELSWADQYEENHHALIARLRAEKEDYRVNAGVNADEAIEERKRAESAESKLAELRTLYLSEFSHVSATHKCSCESIAVGRLATLESSSSKSKSSAGSDAEASGSVDRRKPVVHEDESTTPAETPAEDNPR